MIEFRLPSLGADMDEGKLLDWRVQPGDAVKKGQVVCVVDTAKAAIDVECWHDGTVLRLLVEPGTTIPVGTPMAILRETGESADDVERRVAAAPAARPAAASVAAAPPVTVAPATRAVPPAALLPGARRRVSPAARQRAGELGIDIDDVPEGAGGTVALADVEQAALVRATPPPARAPSPAAPAAATMAERAAQMRKVIGAAMARSKREIPHYYLAEDVQLTAATEWLAEQNATRGVSDRLLLAPLLFKCVATALRRYPEFNGYYRDDAFAPGEGIHIGVAISLRAGGLVTPALLDVDRKDVEQLNRELLDLIRRTRAGSLKRTELSAGTITVTSLGDQGVAAVYGVIYPPQVALVGFGRVSERPWAIGGGLRVAPVATATLAADHRVSDGHRGGLFLAAVRDLLQNPTEVTKASP
jgi:pyruvate dehydrogenase E2 component (dihydrolipoamide acetyltransferase)